jgi:hypothetical protein
MGIMIVSGNESKLARADIIVESELVLGNEGMRALLGMTCAHVMRRECSLTKVHGASTEDGVGDAGHVRRQRAPRVHAHLLLHAAVQLWLSARKVNFFKCCFYLLVAFTHIMKAKEIICMQSSFTSTLAWPIAT